MNLIIDIGNTRVKGAVFSEGEIIHQFSSEEINTKQICDLKSKFPELSSAILSATKDYPENVKIFLSDNFQSFIELNAETPVPIINHYKTPETLGKDRLAAAVAATTLFPNQNVLVIDAGTAITYEVITEKSEYLGGNISPGLTTRFKALNHFTGKLPLVEPSTEFQPIGDDTKSAIRAGVQLGLCFEIERYIDHFNNLYQNLQIIITGGDAKFFDKMLKKTIFVHLNLTLVGLNRILEYNVKET